MKNFLPWIPWFIIGAVLIAAALMIDMGQDRATPRPTKTIKPTVPTVSVTQTPTPVALRCEFPIRVGSVGTPKVLLRQPMRGMLAGEYVCQENDGSLITRSVAFMSSYEATDDANKLLTLCPEKLPNTNFELLWGSCRIGGVQMKFITPYPTKTPTPYNVQP